MSTKTKWVKPGRTQHPHWQGLERTRIFTTVPVGHFPGVGNQSLLGRDDIGGGDRQMFSSKNNATDRSFPRAVPSDAEKSRPQ